MSGKPVVLLTPSVLAALVAKGFAVGIAPDQLTLHKFPFDGGKFVESPWRAFPIKQNAVDWHNLTVFLHEMDVLTLDLRRKRH